jgi:hypothetical protein
MGAAAIRPSYAKSKPPQATKVKVGESVSADPLCRTDRFTS